jgi:hypothetical protein
MPFVAVPQAALVQCIGFVDNQITIIDQSFVNAGTVTEADVIALGDAMADWFLNTLTPQLSDDWTASRVIVTDISNATGPRYEAIATGPGGTSGEASPNNVAACISLRTAQRGRSGHGRNYIPAIPSSLVTLNTIDNAYLASLVTIYEGLIGAGTFVPGWQFCVVSRFSGGVARTPPITIPIVSVTFTSDKVRSMRSRQVGHGA